MQQGGHRTGVRGPIVVLTGAGISVESGLPSFRGADGLWEGHDPMQVAVGAEPRLQVQREGAGSGLGRAP